MEFEKKGQITVFIIIGLIILLVIGTILYLSRKEAVRPFEGARPQAMQVAKEVQPLKDQVEACITRLATDGLRKIGDSGGYIDSTQLNYDIMRPTDGRAVQLSPDAGPNIAYWWHLKSDNKCKQPNCEFGTEMPNLYRTQGGINVESQLDSYITKNLRDCLGNFEEYTKQGCTVQSQGEPQVTTTIAQNDLFFIGKFPLLAVCGDQTYKIEDFYVNINLNIREIFELATELANFQSQQRFLEQVTKNIIATFSALDSSKLPPTRATEVGPPKPGKYWVKFEVLKNIKGLLTAYIPLIQVANVQNYKYIKAPQGARDPKHYELVYNRQFFIPINQSHHSLEARFSYLDWWEPYFDLNCNGQLCKADSASNFMFLPFSINKYEFAYDISYPVMVEIRNPAAFNEEGYSFKFFLEENLRNSNALLTEVKPFEQAPRGTPSIFCNPDQQTSGKVNVYVKDGANLKGLNGASVSYICGAENCNIGQTIDGNLTSAFPRCVGGILRVTKQGYASQSRMISTHREEPQKQEVLLEPVRYLNATIKNFVMTKLGKWEPWRFEEAGGALRPPDEQTATIMLTRQGTAYDEPFSSIAELKGDESKELAIIPGKYSIKIMSFYKGTGERQIIFQPDERCVKISGGIFEGDDEECYNVPTDPLIFNESSPYPYGGAEYEYEFTTTMLRAAKKIEFRQYVQGIDRVPERQRIIEDMQEIEKVQMYSLSNPEKVYPVITS